MSPKPVPRCATIILNPRSPAFKPDLSMTDPDGHGTRRDHRTSGAGVRVGVGVRMGVRMGVRVMDTTDDMVTRPSVSVPQVDIPDV